MKLTEVVDADGVADFFQCLVSDLIGPGRAFLKDLIHVVNVSGVLFPPFPDWLLFRLEDII